MSKPLSADLNPAPPSDLVGRILSPALRLWLRSQLDVINNLQLVIHGKNRQILTGNIPQVFLKADHAVYQGLHLSHAEFTAQHIRINLGQVLKGRPLQLLQPIPVMGEMEITFADLQASLTAPLLATALSDILTELMPPEQAGAIATPQWQTLERVEQAITLTGVTATGEAITLSGQLNLGTPQTLCIEPLRFSLADTAQDLDAFRIDLGPQVAFEHLTVTPEQIQLAGTIKVTP